MYMTRCDLDHQVKVAEVKIVSWLPKWSSRSWHLSEKPMFIVGIKLVLFAIMGMGVLC